MLDREFYDSVKWQQDMPAPYHHDLISIDTANLCWPLRNEKHDPHSLVTCQLEA